MDRFKFRVWDEEAECLHYYSEFEVFDNALILYMTESKTMHYDGESQNPPLEQYTGFKDKTGKRIYEGDIVKMPSRRVKTIEWFQGGFGFWITSEKEFGDFVGFSGHRDLDFVMDGIEVIGNINENPELLEMLG